MRAAGRLRRLSRPGAPVVSTGTLREHAIGHPFTWLTLLAAAPPLSEHVIYAQHSGGYAAHMTLGAGLGYYLQCGMDDRAEDWSDERIWDGLRTRLAAPGFELVEGPLSSARS